MNLRVQQLRGADIAEQLDALATLRTTVFRDWPYLYQGTREYEKHYLQSYIQCPRSLAILIWDGEHCVGASTAQPLDEAPDDVQQPFVEAGMNLSTIDYFGESVVLQSYRGQGLGVKFFELREAHARELNRSHCAFCAVQRSSDDPRKPNDFVSNDQFWSKRGYRKQPDLRTTFSWTDVGEATSSDKPMTFWMRDLT